MCFVVPSSHGEGTTENKMLMNKNIFSNILPFIILAALLFSIIITFIGVVRTVTKKNNGPELLFGTPYEIAGVYHFTDHGHDCYVTTRGNKSISCI